MNIPEAIEVLKRKRETEPGGKLGEDWDALKLGIEALKREKGNREMPDYPAIGQLLGETEE